MGNRCDSGGVHLGCSRYFYRYRGERSLVFDIQTIKGEKVMDWTLILPVAFLVVWFIFMCVVADNRK